MTGLAWSVAIYGFAITLSAQQITAQSSTVVAVPANTEYANNGQSTGPYEGSNANPTAAVSDNGFNDSSNAAHSNNQSWISSNSHWIIILVLCLLVLAALIYYISKSIRGVRKKMLKGDHQDGLPLQNRGGYSAPYEQHMNESIHPPPMYSYEPPKYDQAVRY